MIVATAALCLALNIFHEARSESIPGQYAVALVTMNRAEGDPKQVCQEVFKRRQFSWTNRGVTKVRGGWKFSAKLDPKDEYAWSLAQKVAAHTLAGKMLDFTHGSTFYHTTKVKPIWRLAMTRTKTIGNHRFYILKA